MHLDSFYSTVHLNNHLILIQTNLLCSFLNYIGFHYTILYIIHHRYIVLCVCYPKSSLLPSPFIPPLPSSTYPHPLFPVVITIRWSVSMRSYVSCFCSLCLIPSHFHPALQPPSPQIPLNLFSISLFLFCVLVYVIH